MQSYQSLRRGPADTEFVLRDHLCSVQRYALWKGRIAGLSQQTSRGRETTSAY